MDLVKLEHFKNKDENARSAVASQEVREHLAGFILSKRLGSSSQLSTSGQSSSAQNISTPFKPSSLDRQTIKSSNRQNSVQSSGYQGDKYARALFTSPTVEAGQETVTINSVTIAQEDEDGDHPLRKTASMPTMHIQGKAQSLSRRKQIERRTTLSPLMKRKSRRRTLTTAFGTQSVNISDYQRICRSSTRSQSRSNSPTPANNITTQENTNYTSDSNCVFQSNSSSNNNDIDMLNNNLRSSLYFSPDSSKKVNNCESSNNYNGNNTKFPNSLQKARSNPQLGHEEDANDTCQSMDIVEVVPRIEEKSSRSNLSNISNRLSMLGTIDGLAKQTIHSNTDLTAAINFTLGDEILKLESGFITPTDQQHSNREKQFKDAQTFLRQQQHQKVNEVIRKTVLSRSTSRGRVIASGGSLDIDYLNINNNNTSNATGAKQLSNQFCADDLRQWSLDSSDMFANCSKTLLSAAGKQIATGFRESQKVRLGTTNEAANLRRCQSPSSSISMGRKVALISAHRKQLSSSSSSTSSVLSQQDSFDDSLSQAIDLSSSSCEAIKNRQQHQSMSLQQKQTATNTNNQQQQMQTANPYCQSVLQESFNQLQLCHSTRQRLGRDDIKLLLRSMDTAGQNVTQHAPRLSSDNKASCSLDTASTNQHHQQQQQQQQHQATFFASLSDQFNLSTSAQNLISADPHLSGYSTNFNNHLSNLSEFIQQNSTDHNNHQQRMAFDYNSLLRNFSYQPRSQSQQQPIAPLPAELSALSEPYRSALVTQLVQQQQQQQAQNYLTEHLAGEMKRRGGVEAALAHRSLFERTLSSPLLPTGSVSSSSTHFRKQHSMHMPATTETVSGAGKNCHKQMIVDDDPNIVRCSNQVATNTSLDSRIQHHLNNNNNNSNYNSNQLNDSLASDINFLNFRYTTLDKDQYNSRYVLNPIFDRFANTGITYELELCNHKCTCGDENNHPENSRRILTIWRRLHDKGLMARCTKLESRPATFDELQLCHNETYCSYFGRTPNERSKLTQIDLSKLALEGLVRLDCKGLGVDVDTAWNEDLTPRIARMAAGCVIEAALSVALGKVKNAFAIVRPPGHHAEYQQAMGFCFFNNIAIAAKVLATRLYLKRILIVDFDIHHGNGIQKMFYNDKNVMYISIHRHDKGNFFPGTGYIREIGSGPGEGYNWNIAWFEEVMGDCEYMTAFRSHVMPISREFNPEIVIVACGFDASKKHPTNFGGYQVSSACFGWMTRQLMSLAGGRVVLCLEGGYQLESMAECSEQCVRALLGDTNVEQVDEFERSRRPAKTAVEVLREISLLAAKYWPSTEKYYNTIDMPANAAERI